MPGLVRASKAFPSIGRLEASVAIPMNRGDQFWRGYLAPTGMCTATRSGRGCSRAPRRA